MQTVSFRILSNGIDGELTKSARRYIRKIIHDFPPSLGFHGANKLLAEKLGTTRQRAARLLDALGCRRDFNEKLRANERNADVQLDFYKPPKG